jgi:IS1 family transposase
VWLGGRVSTHRDLTLIASLIALVKTCASALGQGILFCTDGLAHYVSAIREVFREAQPTGQRGRPQLVSWPRIFIAQVIKRQAARCLTGLDRRIVQGTAAAVKAIRHKSQSGGVLNTALIERLNGTFRERLAPLARRTRALWRLPQRAQRVMYLVGEVVPI